MVILLIIWILHLPFGCIFKKCLPWIHKRCFTFVFFGLWIWFFMLWYLYTVILALTDIYQQADEDVLSIASLVIASFYLLLCLAVPVIIFISFCIFWKWIHETIFAELFSGIKIDRCGFRAFYNLSQCIWKIGFALLLMSC